MSDLSTKEPFSGKPGEYERANKILEDHSEQLRSTEGVIGSALGEHDNQWALYIFVLRGASPQLTLTIEIPVVIEIWDDYPKLL